MRNLPVRRQHGPRPDPEAQLEELVWATLQTSLPYFKIAVQMDRKSAGSGLPASSNRLLSLPAVWALFINWEGVPVLPADPTAIKATA